MNVLGFNLTKIHASREEKMDKVASTKTNLLFTDIAKEQAPMLKNDEILKIKFKYEVLYEPSEAEVAFEGIILLQATKELIDEAIKEWGSKKVPESITVPLMNLVMTRCSVKALELEERLNIPLHVKFPHLSLKKD